MAILVIYIVLGILYESFIHPLTILSGLPSAGFGALLTLLHLQDRAEHLRVRRHHHAGRHREEERDHDDRLRARGAARRRARRRARRSTRRCLVRFRPIMMTTMAALHRARCRSRSASAPAPKPAARWVSPSSAGCCVAAPDALHHAGGLHVPRGVSRVARAAPRAGAPAAHLSAPRSGVLAPSGARAPGFGGAGWAVVDFGSSRPSGIRRGHLW